MDVIVVGGGPAGASAAYHLAASGLDVSVFEKGSYPREKVCGDGLTPRGVAQILAMGVNVDDPGWHRTKGMRLIGGGSRIEMPWPTLDGVPNFGLNRSRHDLDGLLVAAARSAGAQVVVDTTVTQPLLNKAGRVIGVQTEDKDGKRAEHRAKLVIAADGVSARFPLMLGLERRPDRQVGVAIRRYYTTPRHDDQYLETHHDLVDPKTGRLIPGYGWIFPMGDGRSNVGIGSLHASSLDKPDYRGVMAHWLRSLPEEWQLTAEHEASPIRGEGLPMGFNRDPMYTRGVMLVGDAGGLVNPFSGEGISCALESGYIAAKIANVALTRRVSVARERALRAYPGVVRQHWGGYYRVGNWFISALSKPAFARSLLRYGFTRPALMRSAMRVVINMTDPRQRGMRDQLMHAVYRMVPAA